MKKKFINIHLPRFVSSFILITILLSCQTIVVEQSIKGTFTDSRDGQVYGWVKIADQIWMSQNLNYKGIQSYSIHQDSSLHGRLYEFPEALLACPEGWHLPSDAEWAQLELALGMSPDEVFLHRTYRYTGDVGHQLKSPTGWTNVKDTLSNPSGFNALPSGHYWHSTNETWYLNSGTVFWTSSTAKLRYAFMREIIKFASIQRRDSYQSQAYSVRCVKSK